MYAVHQVCLAAAVCLSSMLPTPGNLQYVGINSCQWYIYFKQGISWMLTPERIQFMSKDIKNWVNIYSYQRWFMLIFGWIFLTLVSFIRSLVDVPPFKYWNMNKLIISWGRPAKSIAFMVKRKQFYGTCSLTRSH